MEQERGARGAAEAECRELQRVADQALQQRTALQHDVVHAEERLRNEQQRRCSLLDPDGRLLAKDLRAGGKMLRGRW